MNNLRFKNGGKRKAVVPMTLSQADSKTTVNYQAAVQSLVSDLGQSPKLVRLTSIDYEMTTNFDSFQAGTYLKDITGFGGRPMNLMASNNEGVDGTYKVPTESIYSKWQSATSTGTISLDVELGGLPAGSASNEITVVVYVHLEYVE